MVLSKQLFLALSLLKGSFSQLITPTITYNDAQAVTITCADTLTNINSAANTLSLLHSHVLTVDCAQANHYIEIGPNVPSVEVLCPGSTNNINGGSQSCDSFSILSAATNTQVNCLGNGCLGTQVKCTNKPPISLIPIGVAVAPIDQCVVNCEGDASCESVGLYCEGEFNSGCKIEAHGDSSPAMVNSPTANSFGFSHGIASVISCDFDAMVGVTPACGAVSDNYAICGARINTNLDCEHVNIHCPAHGNCCNGMDCSNPNVVTTASVTTSAAPATTVQTTKAATTTQPPLPTTTVAATTTQVAKMVIPVFEWSIICGRNGILEIPGAEGWVKQFNGLICTDVIFECHDSVCKVECNANNACTNVEVRSIGAGTSGGAAINLGSNTFGGRNTFGSPFSIGSTTEIQVECKYRNSCINLKVDSESSKTEVQCGKAYACVNAVVNCPTTMNVAMGNAHEYVCEVKNTELMSFQGGSLNCADMVGGRCRLFCQTNVVNVGVMPLGMTMTEDQKLAAAVARRSFCYDAKFECPSGIVGAQGSFECTCLGSAQDCPVSGSLRKRKNKRNRNNNNNNGLWAQNNNNNPQVPIVPGV